MSAARFGRNDQTIAQRRQKDAEGYHPFRAPPLIDIFASRLLESKGLKSDCMEKAEGRHPIRPNPKRWPAKSQDPSPARTEFPLLFWESLMPASSLGLPRKTDFRKRADDCRAACGQGAFLVRYFDCDGMTIGTLEKTTGLF